MYNNFLSQPQQKERKKVNSLKIYSHVPENQYIFLSIYSSTIKKITYYKKNILKINKTIIHSCTEKKRIDPPKKAPAKKRIIKHLKSVSFYYTRMYTAGYSISQTIKL